MSKGLIDNKILRFLLKDIITKLRESSDFQSVAIRLRKDGDCPYFLHMGFPDIFIQKENSLNIKDGEGNAILAADGTPVVECMCGNILKSRTNPKYPYFTKDGAFWTNSTTRLLGSLTEKEQQEIGRTRNTCHNYGYESVALIPVRANDIILGLIQINDSRDNMFSLEKIKKYQSLADHIGVIVSNILEFYEKVAQSFDPASELENVVK